MNFLRIGCCLNYRATFPTALDRSFVTSTLQIVSVAIFSNLHVVVQKEPEVEERRTYSFKGILVSKSIQKAHVAHDA